MNHLASGDLGSGIQMSEPQASKEPRACVLRRVTSQVGCVSTRKQQ